MVTEGIIPCTMLFVQGQFGSLNSMRVGKAHAGTPVGGLDWLLLKQSILMQALARVRIIRSQRVERETNAIASYNSICNERPLWHACHHAQHCLYT